MEGLGGSGCGLPGGGGLPIVIAGGLLIGDPLEAGCCACSVKAQTDNVSAQVNRNPVFIEERSGLGQECFELTFSLA